MNVAFKRATPLIMGFAFTSFAIYTLLQPKPAMTPAVNKSDARSGIIITDQFNQEDFESSDLMRAIIARYINLSTIPGIQAQLLMEIPVLVDSTATTQILDYKVHLRIKGYQHDAVRTISTTVRADDGTPPGSIKEQAVVEFSRVLAAQLTASN
jgi:hypothetical protein